MTFNGNYCTPPPIPIEKHKDSDYNHILKNYSEAPTNANNAKNKKRKINKKDSVEDFVFPKKTARPVSPLPSHNVTVNGDRYRATITNFFIPELNNHDVQELWFQQDGATCPTARATIDLLKDTFGDRLISRFGPVNWPPRSCDLTPLDYFLWGYVKSLVYADKPQTLDHLEDNIRRVIADIRPQMLENVIENWTSRLDYIRASRGNHMTEIIWKM
ncbi:transposable element Tc3 transposase [Trichonephila clavipes]|uniref:Transposable element Tc3 transposase n=1 Tax=Trichonephila clavipes TaxID=2585209 RepID=A0A8X6SHB4_TRICX|nr:transposable element Tc3 transposase [Trichonephila clavipes]